MANIDPHRPGLGRRGGPLPPAHLYPDGALDHRSAFASTPRRTTRAASPPGADGAGRAGQPRRAIVAELGIGDGGKRTGTQLALATVTIFLSWTFIHTIFALNYAHDYYGEHGAKRSGLKFPDDADPDYWDFVYFSFVVGMTCQVSDVAVASQPIRRTVIAHGVVSFFFNTALLALTVNIAASAI